MQCKPIYSSILTIAISGVMMLSAEETLSAAEATTGFSVSGVATFAGKPPERLPIDMARDPKCIAAHGGEEVLDEALLVSGDGQIQNVFLFVENVESGDYAMPESPAILSQSGCMYRPRVQGIRVGQKLQIVNSDPLLHNVRSFARKNRPFNIGQPKEGTREKTFTQVEHAIKIKCDIHPWMTAHFFVLDHPFFAVTDEAGAFAIEGLPAGDYVLQAWHESLGKLQKEITVSEDIADANFLFEPSKK